MLLLAPGVALLAYGAVITTEHPHNKPASPRVVHPIKRAPSTRIVVRPITNPGTVPAFHI